LEKINKIMKSTHKLSMVATVGVIAATTLSVNPASAFMITVGGQPIGSPLANEGITTEVPNTIVIDFNDAVASPFTTVDQVAQNGAMYSPGNALVINNGGVPVSQTGAIPYSGPPAGSTNNQSAYLSLPTNDNIGESEVTITLPQLSNYWGMHWGSIDATNKIEFINGKTSTSVMFTGEQLAALIPDDIVLQGGPANQTDPQSNPYINFFSEGSGEWFNTVKLTQLGNNNNIAFESDNHAYRPVPEPLTILGSGLALGFGAIFKKQQSRRR
jgi:hypothetical protein